MNKPLFLIDIIDDRDMYIARDVLTDDLIFLTPEDVLGDDTSYHNTVNPKTNFLFSEKYL